VSYASFSPDNRLLATGAWHAKEVSIWERRAAQTNLQERHTLREEKAGFSLVEFSPEGARLVVQWGPHLTLYDTTHWQPVWNRAVTDNLPVMAWSPAGDLLALRDANKFIRLLHPDSGSVQASLEMPNGFSVLCLTFSLDGTRLAAISASTRELFV
jgi:WD40 repeat protein